MENKDYETEIETGKYRRAEFADATQTLHFDI